MTFDLDLVLDHEATNLDRSFDLLQELDAVYREHLPKRIEPIRADLESDGSMFLMTRLGPLDIFGRVATGWRYDELQQRARSVQVDTSLEIQVLDLAALIEVKELVEREKDRAVLPLYRTTLRERVRGGGLGILIRESASSFRTRTYCARTIFVSSRPMKKSLIGKVWVTGSKSTRKSWKRIA